jgi:hypothetical protein
VREEKEEKCLHDDIFGGEELKLDGRVYLDKLRLLSRMGNTVTLYATARPPPPANLTTVGVSILFVYLLHTADNFVSSLSLIGC